MYYSTHRGWQVQKTDENGNHLYLKRVYKGEPEWVTDYLYAKCFSEATAKKHNDKFVGDTPEDPWEKVLLDRIKKTELKEADSKEEVYEAISHFKEWVNSRTDTAIVNNIVFQAQQVEDAYKRYHDIWSDLDKMKRELAAYRLTVGTFFG